MANILASINILDIIVISLTVLFLLFGIWRGMYKIIFGFISSLTALVLAIVLMSPVVNWAITNTLVDEKVVQLIAQPISAAVPNSDQVIAFYDLDDNEETPDALGYEIGGEKKPFSELLAGSKISFLGSTIESLISSEVQSSEEGMSFISAIVGVLTAYLLSGAAFIILWILMWIVIRILCYFLKKIVTATYIGYFFNRVMGGVLGLVIVAVLVFGFLTVVKAMANYEVIIPINQMIENSTITKLISQNNFLYTFIEGRLDLQSIIDKIMEAMAKVGL